MEKHRYFIVYAIDLGKSKKISLAVSIKTSIARVTGAFFFGEQ